MNICCGGGLLPQDLSKLPYEDIEVKIKDKKKTEEKKVNLKETQLNNYFNTINSSLMNQSIQIRNVKKL